MLSEKQTLLCGTRYGNVIGTRGSVVPLFIKQIKAGDPLTITDPEMTRFLMPLEEALKLVMVALQNGRQGDLFVQKSPACTIGDLAAAIKELFKAKNKIVTIGTRHGEKRHETLLTRDERARCEDLGDYFRILPDIRDLNYNKYFVEGEQRISSENDYTSSNTTRLKVSQIIETLREVPYIQSELKAYFGKNNRG
jgi:UDP-glucose 4-epimerase